MTSLELLTAVAGLLWVASFLGLSVKLVRARSPEDHEEAYQMMTAVIVAGIIMFVAPSAVQWLTGFDEYPVGGTYRYCSKDPDDLEAHQTVDEVCLPDQMSSIFDKIINGLRALGGVVLVVGLIWAGIKLAAVPRGRPSRSSPQAAGAIRAP